MASIVTIAGSPSAVSRSGALLDYAAKFLEQHHLHVQHITVRDLDPAELLHAKWDGSTIRPAIQLVDQAKGLIIATPVYKAAYTGILKAFLDLLPQGALENKVVLPIVSGGTAGHSLSLDYALKPVLAALAAEPILKGIYLMDSEFEHTAGTDLRFLDEQAESRMKAALERFVGIMRVLHG